MEKKKHSYVRVGTVMKSKEGDGSYISLGNPKAKNEKYRHSVRLQVLDASGKVVAEQTNGFLSVFDPRRNEDREVPEQILYEISLRKDA